MFQNKLPSSTLTDKFVGDIFTGEDAESVEQIQNIAKSLIYDYENK